MGTQYSCNRLRAAYFRICSALALISIGCGGENGDAPVSSSKQALIATVNPFNESFTIGAWYFTAWSAVNDAQAFWSKNSTSINRWDPWGGVRDGYLNPAVVPNNSAGTYQTRKPTIGFYDLMDQRVMDKHIVQAASRGLSYFAFYWYWDARTQAEAQGSTPIHRFLSSPNKNQLKFMIAPMVVNSGVTTLQSFEQRMVPYIVDTFFSDPSYLTTTDGMPIITDWAFGLADTDRPAGIAYLRDYAYAKLGKNLLVLRVTEAGVDAQNDDGVMCFQNNLNPVSLLNPGAQQSIDYGQMMQHFTWPNPSGLTSSMANVPCTTAGFDPRPWCMNQGWSCVAPPVGPNQSSIYYYYNTGLGSSRMTPNLYIIRAVFNGNVPAAMRMLTVYAWNEWGEGGAIEPSERFGTGYLDVIKQYFTLTARGTDTANVSLEATFTEPVNEVSVFVSDAYQTLLGRAASQTELASYGISVLDKRQFIQDVCQSPEYATKWSSQLSTTSGTVNLIYQQLLGRAPTSAESSKYTPVVAGYGRSVLVDELLFLPEHFKKDPILAPNYGTTVSAEGLAQVYRLYSGSDYFFTSDIVELTAARQPNGGGYAVQGPAWKVFTSGTNRVPLYRCRYGSFHFASLQSNCEGQTVEGVMGYGNATAIQGSVALQRYAASSGAHVELLSTDTAKINEVLAAGFHNEGTLLYLPSW